MQENGVAVAADLNYDSYNIDDEFHVMILVAQEVNTKYVMAPKPKKRMQCCDVVFKSNFKKYGKRFQSYLYFCVIPRFLRLGYLFKSDQSQSKKVRKTQNDLGELGPNWG